jgi:hypothetical protein
MQAWYFTAGQTLRALRVTYTQGVCLLQNASSAGLTGSSVALKTLSWRQAHEQICADWAGKMKHLQDCTGDELRTINWKYGRDGSTS